MNQNPFPEANRPKPYPIFGDLKLNAWAFVAVLAAQPAHWMLPAHPEDWWAGVRALLALAPLLPGFLWMRSVWRWINSLDEMQRLIQYEACFISAVGTIFLSTALGLLNQVGVIQSVRLRNGLGWEGTFALMVCLYLIGCVTSNRRYQ